MNRASIRLLVVATLSSLLACRGTPRSESVPGTEATWQRPNVVIIYTDDQGTLDLGCYGSEDLITPNLDALASRGVRFTQMYAPSSICTPSRAGLLTGRIPARAGITGNASSQRGNPGMPTEEVTIAEMLKAGGYATGHVGKWHLGYTPETMPNSQGFDYSFGHMGGCIDNYSHYFYWQGPNRHDLWRNGEEIWQDGKFFLDLMTHEAIEFIDRNKERPFFLYWAMNAPHYPLQGTQKWRRRYKDLPSPRDKYAAFLSTADEHIGVFLAKLDELGLREKTLIVFQSDQGHSVELRNFGGGGNAGPYRGAKATLFEGGIRIPAIVSWPGIIPEGGVRDQMVVGCDWLPTISELARVDLPKRKLDGRSLVEVFQSADAETPHKTFYWRIAGGEKAQWAVREGAWKLYGNPIDNTRVTTPPTEKDELFLANLRWDERELTNFVADYPDVVARLQNYRNKYERDFRRK